MVPRWPIGEGDDTCGQYCSTYLAREGSIYQEWDLITNVSPFTEGPYFSRFQIGQFIPQGFDCIAAFDEIWARAKNLTQWKAPI